MGTQSLLLQLIYFRLESSLLRQGWFDVTLLLHQLALSYDLFHQIGRIRDLVVKLFIFQLKLLQLLLRIPELFQQIFIIVF